MHQTSLFWFNNDLRLEDQPALQAAAHASKELLCVFIVEPSWFSPTTFSNRPMGDHRWQFLHQCMSDLQRQLKTQQQDLLILYAPPVEALSQLITLFGIDAIYRSQHAGFYENHHWHALQKRFPQLHFEEQASHTLFAERELPFDRHACPNTFSAFCEQVSQLSIPEPLRGLPQLPPQPRDKRMQASRLPALAATQIYPFIGGASAGQQHLKNYFSSDWPHQYQQHCDALDGWAHSTKLSPWLAHGCLSARSVVQAIQAYESEVVRNDSTTSLLKALLWREYFLWYAHQNGAKIFSQNGLSSKKLLSSFYAERYQRWCQGNTPYAIVNACMKQLNTTGYLSNRGRQVVASCLINELHLDWRFGAGYFQQQLIDYDVALNWGNWQYFAGIAGESNVKTHLDLQAQTAKYDPNGEFIAKWHGQAFDGPLDTVDAADWPIYPPNNDSTNP